MSAISKMINQLNTVYATTSVEKVKELCNVAGVDYKEPNQARELAQDLHSRGFVLRIAKHSQEDVAVGQSLVLRDLQGTFVQGFEVWIDFQDDYKVKTRQIINDDDINRYDSMGVLH